MTGTETRYYAPRQPAGGGYHSDQSAHCLAHRHGFAALNCHANRRATVSAADTWGFEDLCDFVTGQGNDLAAPAIDAVPKLPPVWPVCWTVVPHVWG